MRNKRANSPQLLENFDSVAFFEFMLAMAIIGVLFRISLPIYFDYVLSARLTEAYIAGSALRISLVERLALSGDPVEIPLSGDAVSSVSFETHLGGQGTVERPKTATPADGEKDAAAKGGLGARSRLGSYGSVQDVQAREDQTGTTRFVSTARITGNAIHVAGNIGRDYEIWTYPAVTDEDTPSVYRWLCGGGVPEGWLAQSRTSRSSFPDRLLVYECRARKAP